MSDEYIKKKDALLRAIDDVNSYFLIHMLPAEDVTQVIRCKDCRYYQDNNGGYPNADCKWCKDETPDANDYCSCGERKDDE